jgi:DNA modification methylase
LKIGYTRTCDCRPKNLSCITAKKWMARMSGIVEFFYGKRDIRDKKVHPAVFPIALPKYFIELLSHKGELVLDPFNGIGTTLVAAQDSLRNAVGFDLQQKYMDITKSRLVQSRLVDNSQQVAINDDANNIPEYFEPETIALCITSPPYPEFLTHKRTNKSYRGDLRKNEHYETVQQYSQDPRDLGLMSHPEYTKAMTNIYKGIYPLMKPGAHCIVNINDLWKENQRYVTHGCVIKALTDAGFQFRNTIIWDKRNLVNNAGIFGWPSNYITMGATYEYILDFRKPPGPETIENDSLDCFNPTGLYPEDLLLQTTTNPTIQEQQKLGY